MGVGVGLGVGFYCDVETWGVGQEDAELAWLWRSIYLDDLLLGPSEMQMPNNIRLHHYLPLLSRPLTLSLHLHILHILHGNLHNLIIESNILSP